MDIVPESFSALIPVKPAAVYKFGGEAGSGKAGETGAVTHTIFLVSEASQVIGFFFVPDFCQTVMNLDK